MEDKISNLLDALSEYEHTALLYRCSRTDDDKTNAIKGKEQYYNIKEPTYSQTTGKVRAEIDLGEISAQFDYLWAEQNIPEPQTVKDLHATPEHSELLKRMKEAWERLTTNS